MTRRETRQCDLFPDNDEASPLPTAVKEAVFALLIQWLQAMIPILTPEVNDEQDHL